MCSLENMLWFCGFTHVKTEKGLQFVILPRKLDVVLWFDPSEGEKDLHFDMFSRKYAVVFWFHPGED